MSIQFRSRIKSTIDYSKILNGVGVCCDKDGNKTLKAFYDCFDDGGNYFPGENLAAVNCPGIDDEKGCCCACSFVEDLSLLLYPWNFITSSPVGEILYLESGVMCDVSRCECERIKGKFTPSTETTIELTTENISSMCYRPAPEFGGALLIDARYPRSCCHIGRDPVTGFPTEVICDNVCVSSDCAALGSASNPAVFNEVETCGNYLYIINGTNDGISNCASSSNITRMATREASSVETVFGSCYTIALSPDTTSYEYTCDITAQSACSGYWVGTSDPVNPFCNDRFTPTNPVRIQNIYDAQRISQSDFNSLNLQIGMEYQGGVYIGVYEPGSPITSQGSALYGNMNFAPASTHYVSNVGIGGTDKKWAIIVDTNSYAAMPFIEADEDDIYYSTSLWDGYYNTYGNNVNFYGIRTKLTNTIRYKPKNGFIDYYIPSLYELYFYAKYLTTHEATFPLTSNGYYYSSTMFNSNYINNNSNTVQINNTGLMYSQALTRKNIYEYPLKYDTVLIPKNTNAKFSFFRKIIIED